MTAPEPRPSEDRPVEDRSAEGRTTARKGTPAPVELSTPRGLPAAMASFLAGPVIWTVHFLVVYLVLEAGCTGSGPGLRWFDPPVPALATLAATAVAMLACAGTAVWSLRRFRAGARHSTAGRSGAASDRGLDFVGFLLSLLGVVTVLFVGLPALWLPACGP